MYRAKEFTLCTGLRSLHMFWNKEFTMCAELRSLQGVVLGNEFTECTGLRSLQCMCTGLRSLNSCYCRQEPTNHRN